MIDNFYIIITPAKNEANYISYTLESVCAQTLKPMEWIIVDDGSTDNTVQIINQFRKRYPWIKIIQNMNPLEKRSGGSKVVNAFYKGYEKIEKNDYNFLVKLDADLTLPENYFEEVNNCFLNNPDVGICGGYCSNLINNKLVREKTAEFHVRGAFKSYRKKCFMEIGGIKPVWDWDGLDQMTAMFLGWNVKVLPLEVIHHRVTSKEYNLIKHSFKSGKEYYKMGYGLPLSILKSIYMLNKSPLIIRSLSFFLGFTLASIKRIEKITSPDLAKFIRRFQYNRLLRKNHS